MLFYLGVVTLMHFHLPDHLVKPLEYFKPICKGSFVSFFYFCNFLLNTMHIFIHGWGQSEDESD